jgi:hypothetical protein
MRKALRIFGLVTPIVALTTSSTSATTTDAAVFTSESGITVPNSITDDPTSSSIIHQPTFTSLSNSQASVRGIYLGSASVIDVADGKTTYSYICPTSTKTLTTFGGLDGWNACGDSIARTATFIDGPSQYVYYAPFEWNTQTVSGFDVYDSSTTFSWTSVSTDSINHTVPLTTYIMCDVSRTVIKTQCSISFTASAMNSAESSEVSSLNYVVTAIFTDDGPTTTTTWGPSAWITLGPIPVVSGADKLSSSAKPTVSQQSGVRRQLSALNLGLMLAVLGISLYL